MPEEYDDLKADFASTVPVGRYPNANDGRWGAALEEWQRRRGTDADRRTADYHLYREMVNAAIEIHGEAVAEAYRVTIRRHREERDRYIRITKALSTEVSQVEDQRDALREQVRRLHVKLKGRADERGIEPQRVN